MDLTGWSVSKMTRTQRRRRRGQPEVKKIIIVLQFVSFDLRLPLLIRKSWKQKAVSEKT